MGSGAHGFLLLGILSLAWGSSYLFQDVAVEEIDPLAVTAFRLGVAAAVLGLAMLARGRRPPQSVHLWLLLAAIGVVGNVLPFLLVTWAQQEVKSSVAGILVGATPLITLALAHIFTADERITPRRVAGFGLGFIGIVVLLGPKAMTELQAGAGAPLSYIALLGAALCFAATAVLSARLPAIPASTAGFGVLLTAAAAAGLLAMIWAKPLPDRPTLDAVGSLAVLALLVTPVGTYAYFRLAATAGATFLSLFNYFNPLVAVLLGVLVLDEKPGAEAFAALTIILAGVAISQSGGRAGGGDVREAAAG